MRRAKAEPYLLMPALLALVRGWWYRIKFRVLCKRVRMGKYFRVYGPLIITGPGRVEFGDNVLIISDAIKPVCIRTLSRNATVTLGDHSGLNGTSIQCVESVKIGHLSNIADAYISDSAAHSIGINRRQETALDAPHAPVVIGENVWVSVQCVILHGVTIGDNSVVGACSLVREEVAEHVLVAGNPLRVIKSIDVD